MDKVIQLDESSIPVLQDTLAILTSKEIKLSSLRRYVHSDDIVLMYVCAF